MLDAARQADVIFFGEQHNNPIAHWLQLSLAQALAETEGSNLVLGAEMFEADNQLLIDEYLAGHINQKSFEQEARLWDNYETDYKPLLELTKKEGLNFVATNIPRRYANLVFREGLEALESLSETAKQYLAPLPIPYDPELPGYQQMLTMMGGHGGEKADNFPKAQAIKDATMAHFLAENRPANSVFLHFNGSYHSANYEGIIWYLNRYQPNLKISSITTVEQQQLNSLEAPNADTADYIIVVDAQMTKTY